MTSTSAASGADSASGPPGYAPIPQSAPGPQSVTGRAGSPGRPPVTMATPPDDNSLGRAYTAPEITVFYDRGRCRHYAECVRGLRQVFDPARRPWIRADLADADTVAEVVRRCPTGALHYRLLTDKPEEPSHPTVITLDPPGATAGPRRSCPGHPRGAAG